ncbi:MAG: FtsK/SpoIIIE domain-containing protein [Acutalibacteraceae bacterium]
MPEQDGNDLIIVPGKNTKNEYETCNLSVAANMLVVGSSGSGKSNFLYAVITSLVFNRSPENLKLLLIATTKPNLRRFADCRILLPNLSSKSQIFKTYSVSLCFA